MSLKAKLAIGLGVVATLAVTLLIGIWLGSMQTNHVASIPATPSVTAINRSSAPRPASTIASAGTMEDVPWARDGGSASTARADAPSTQQRIEDLRERKQRLAELRELQQAIAKSMQDKQQPDPQKVDALLLKIKEIKGSSIIGGVDIDELRGRLAKTQEMQALATQIQQEAAKGSNADAEKIKALSAQLQTLNTQLAARAIAKAPVTPEKP